MSGWLPFCQAIIEAIIPPREDSPRYNPFAPEGETDDLENSLCKKLQALNFLRDNIELPCLHTTQPAALKTPVILGHGTANMTMDVKLGQDAASALRTLGTDVTRYPYEEFGHWFKEPEEIDDMVEFLREKMGLESL